jgi:hypothetical protein
MNRERIKKLLSVTAPPETTMVPEVGPPSLTVVPEPTPELPPPLGEPEVPSPPEDGKELAMKEWKQEIAPSPEVPPTIEVPAPTEPITPDAAPVDDFAIIRSYHEATHDGAAPPPTQVEEAAAALQRLHTAGPITDRDQWIAFGRATGHLAAALTDIDKPDLAAEVLRIRAAHRSDPGSVPPT